MESWNGRREGKKDAGRTEKVPGEALRIAVIRQDHENKVTMKEVRDFFEDFALDEQKVTFVCEYLTMEQVDVADYEPGVVPEETEKEKKKPEFSEEDCVPYSSILTNCRRQKHRRRKKRQSFTGKRQRAIPLQRACSCSSGFRKLLRPQKKCTPAISSWWIWCRREMSDF